jgi:eukaryotic-like serine/threonine-protein kinase
MPRPEVAPRDLLIGLLALQNGMVNQPQLVAAFGAWTTSAGRAMADLLVEQGALTDSRRALLEALLAEHLAVHGGDAEKSLAAITVGQPTRESLSRLGDATLRRRIEARFAVPTSTLDGKGERADGGHTLTHAGSGRGSDGDPDRTGTYSAGAASGDGQRFRVLRPHAKGGLGAVFVALDTELHREVALKQMLDHHADDSTSRQRFLVEAEITGGLEHPGIVPVYGLGTYADGRPYYAMRFIKGDSLKEAIERFHADIVLQAVPGRRSLELRRLLGRFVDVCNAIEYAHSRGVLHRDLKPGNIIVGKHGETLVVDWGLAKATGRSEAGAGERTLVPSSARASAETLPGSALGTPAYMSPEQAAGDLELLGPRSDVYGLGATLYCLLTGRPPYDGDDVGELLRRVQRGDFARPRQLDPSIDPPLEAVCSKAMATKPEDRYGRCRQLADDIERWLADEPVSAWREPLARRARRWAKRNRTMMSAAVVALVLGVLGLGAVTGVQARANQKLFQAKRATDTALAETSAAKQATDTALAETRKAQAETKAALAQSEESRKQAEAVSSFLVDAFRSPDPAQTGREVRVADVLDRASSKLDKEFSGSPATKGVLLDALGETYMGLGLYNQAVSLETRARAVREAALGPDHPDTLTTLDRLATNYGYAGRLSEAIELNEVTLKRREAKLGPDHPDTIASRISVALAYAAAGRTTEAIALGETTLKLSEAKLGPDHSRTLRSRVILGNAYIDAHRWPEAIVLNERTLKLYEAKLGPDHPYTLMSRSNLAITYWGVGRLSEAIALHETTLKLRESALGPDHPHTLSSRTNLASAYANVGRLSEAIALDEQALKLHEAKLGPDHPNTLIMRGNLANQYREAGRLSEAIGLLEQTVRLSEAKLGPDHFSTIWGRAALALAYESLDRRAEAEGLRREVLVRRRRAVQSDSPLLAEDLAALGLNLMNQGRWPEAEPLLREGLAIRMKAMPDDWSRYDATSLLGGALLGQGRYAEAEPFVVEGYQGMSAREGRISVPDRFRLREAAERVVRLYDDWGKLDQASAWKARLGLPDLPANVFARP